MVMDGYQRLLSSMFINIYGWLSMVNECYGWLLMVMNGCGLCYLVLSMVMEGGHYWLNLIARSN